MVAKSPSCHQTSRTIRQACKQVLRTPSKTSSKETWQEVKQTSLDDLLCEHGHESTSRQVEGQEHQAPSAHPFCFSSLPETHFALNLIHHASKARATHPYFEAPHHTLLINFWPQILGTKHGNKRVRERNFAHILPRALRAVAECTPRVWANPSSLCFHKNTVCNTAAPSHTQHNSASWHLQ